MIVVGAGHAGCEAALAASRMGCGVLLFAIDIDKLASMPCSPSIGGMAKGQLVKEIDALGGEMARIADKTAMQYKTLNMKKGPAVRATRTQNDKNRYHIEMKSVIEKQENLDLKQGLVENLLVEDGVVRGVCDHTGFCYHAEAVVLAVGTFFSGRVHIGMTSIKAGRAGEFASYGLPENLRNLGFKTGRMKTGTPPRLDRKSIDFACFEEHDADIEPEPFSFFTKKIVAPRIKTHIGRTNRKSHEIVRENLLSSSLYSGAIKGVSARYCPSFEDKIVRFPEKESHQIILESEGMETDEIYASGLGNSLPVEIQTELVHSVKGLENADIIRPAYAIEYDYVNPVHLKPTLETKAVASLFMAGQINGTSGYEEAAAQGLWAGINAALKIRKRPPFILDRSEAFMGVMVDDLVTKGTSEPYRMFTSRAEYRLMLREDNADLRLMKKGHELGLVDQETLNDVKKRGRLIRQEIKRIKTIVVKPGPDVNKYLESKNSPPLKNGVYLDNLLKRAELTYDAVANLSESPCVEDPKVFRQVETEIKYEGYIKRQKKEIEKFKDLERINISRDFDFMKVHGLSSELKDKLSKIKPASLGQASRVEGITPAAVSAIMITLKVLKKKRRNRKKRDQPPWKPPGSE